VTAASLSAAGGPASGSDDREPVPAGGPGAGGFHIRRGVPADLDALVALEGRVFTTDRLSRRSFRELLVAKSAVFLVAHRPAQAGGAVVGYALLLFRRGTGLARLYSIAVAPEVAGRGIGRDLLAAAEAAAVDLGKVMLRLEVAVDNGPARALYGRAGYRSVRRLSAYYEDGGDALRLEKSLRPRFGIPSGAPYYAQSTEFTCGPACLMMALARFGLIDHLEPVLEIRLWREATTIFMGSGLGGCEPVGMAVAALEAGLAVELHISEAGPLMLQTVADAAKRRVMSLAQQDFDDRARRLGLRRHPPLDARGLAGRVATDALAIVLISGNRMYGQRQPHWVVAHGLHEGHLMVHDPWVVDDGFESATDAINIPIPLDEFDRMSRFGRAGLRAALLVTGRAANAPARESAILSGLPAAL
jgi:ribosomal protein S18 acetylase RimI-like enzyme